MTPAAWRIEYLVVVDRDIPALPKRIRGTIEWAIEMRLASDPVGYGKPLWYSLAGHRRLRVGDYRIVYRVAPASKTVIVSVIQHRKDAYGDGPTRPYPGAWVPPFMAPGRGRRCGHRGSDEITARAARPDNSGGQGGYD
ncbi:MAG: type II toxin-antitoxin system RelE family toxin [Pseudomonadota bacterium]